MVKKDQYRVGVARFEPAMDGDQASDLSNGYEASLGDFGANSEATWDQVDFGEGCLPEDFSEGPDFGFEDVGTPHVHDLTTETFQEGTNQTVPSSLASVVTGDAWNTMLVNAFLLLT